MKSVFKPVLLAALLTTAGVGAFSQMQAMGEGDACHGNAVYERMGHKDPAWKQARMEKRAAELKAALKLSPLQEGAWATFAAAMKPLADLRTRHQSSRAGLTTLPTPERIDKMKALHTQHAQERMAVVAVPTGRPNCKTGMSRGIAAGFAAREPRPASLKPAFFGVRRCQ